jgi:transposase InsO family protein
LYLAVIMDLYSRQIVGWAMANRMTDNLVIHALKMALFRRQIPSGLLLHSDRGSQYASIIAKKSWHYLQHESQRKLLG